MEIISDLSKICSGTVILCKANEVIMPAYVLNNFILDLKNSSEHLSLDEQRVTT